MKDKPILFTPENIKKIRADEKWQTRRVVKPQPVEDPPGYLTHTDRRGLEAGAPVQDAGWWFGCPYGHIGDRLWVKESLWKDREGVWRYALDNEAVQCDPADETAMITWAHHKETSSHSALFMPKWAARTWLEITSVRVERIKDISLDDMRAEGVRPDSEVSLLWRETLTQNFITLWNAINGKEYPWSSNPWIWVIDFKKIEL